MALERRKTTTRVHEQGATYDDYAAIPDEAGRFELLDGQLLAMSPAPSLLHQMVSQRLQQALYRCSDDYIILYAPLDVILSPHSVLQPDIVVVHRDKTHILAYRGIEGPPNIVVEILSPSTAHNDRGKKKDIYAHYGVPEYWIVELANFCLEQYVMHDGEFKLYRQYTTDDVVKSPNVPCVSFTMTGLVANLPPLRG